MPNRGAVDNNFNLLNGQQPGIGMARPPTVVPPPGPITPQPQPNLSAAGSTQTGAPDFKTNPLGAVGLVLSNVAAGMRGQELPTERMVKDQMERQANNLRLLGAGLGIADKLLQAAANVPEPQRAALIEKNLGILAQTMPPEMLGPIKDYVSIGEAGRTADIAKKRQRIEFMKRHGLLSGSLFELVGGDTKAMDVILDKITEGVGEAAGKVAGARGAAELLGVPVAETAQAAGLTPTAKDEFNRNMQRMLDLEKAGQQGSKEYKLLAKRVAKQTEGVPGFTMEFDDEGNLKGVRYGPGSAALTAQQALRQQEQLDEWGSVIGTLDETIATLRQNPDRAGVMGAIKNFAQDIVGVVGDVAPKEWTDRIKETIAAIPGITDEEANDLNPFFDVALPETQIMQNTIALALAKMRIQAGGSSIRALKDAFEKAQEDVAIRGMFSSQNAIARLEKVREEFARSRAALGSRFMGQEGEAPQDSGEWITLPNGTRIRQVQ